MVVTIWESLYSALCFEVETELVICLGQFGISEDAPILCHVTFMSKVVISSATCFIHSSSAPL